MGLAASQARFLSLTARKTNVEYEGQQINQQRTALANQSAGLFNQMLSLEVPTPPSASDYTKTYYSFNDITSSKTIAIDNIYINEAMSGNGSTYATVMTTQKESITVANYDVLEGCGLSKGEADRDGNVDYYFEMDGRRYTLNGPSTVDSLVDEFGEAYNQATITDSQGNTTTPSGLDEPKDKDKYFYFTNTQTGVVYYIPAGNYRSIEQYYNAYEESEDTFNPVVYATQGATKTTSKTYEDVQLISSNDGTGRYESMIYTDPETGKKITFPLTLQTVQDEDAYNEAMATYEAKKDEYDKAVAEIDAKTTIIQQQDKTLELHLQQLDTEQQAIQTEMESIKKVIDKNIDETFKAFA